MNSIKFLEAGTEVYVGIRNENGAGMFGNHCSFSGFLLQAEL